MVALEDKKYLFEKLDDEEWLFNNIGYDFASAGHFHPHKHSVNGRATIKVKNCSNSVATEQYGSLSKKDIRKIKMLYNYIIEKKTKKNRIEQCSKLFTIGKKTSKKELCTKDKKPQSKPNINPNLNDKREREEQEGNKRNLEGGNRILVPDIDFTEPTYYNKNENKVISYGTYAISKPIMKIKPKQLLGRILKPTAINETQFLKHYYKDPLTYLSDYDTGDDNYQRSIAKKTNAYSNFIKLAEFWQKNK